MTFYVPIGWVRFTRYCREMSFSVTWIETGLTFKLTTHESLTTSGRFTIVVQCYNNIANNCNQGVD